MVCEKMIETVHYPRTTKLVRMEMRQTHHPDCTRSVFDFANHLAKNWTGVFGVFLSTTIFVSRTASEAFLSWTQQRALSGATHFGFTFRLSIHIYPHIFCVRAPHRWIWAYRPSPSHSQPAIPLDIYSWMRSASLLCTPLRRIFF